MTSVTTTMDSMWVSSPENSPTYDYNTQHFRASATLTWMIERSITAECTALDNKIAKLLATLTSFVRHVREARSDVDAVSRELHSLQTVLILLKEDAALFPPELAQHTPAIIEHCSYVIDKLDESLLAFDSPELSKQEKRTQWLDRGRTEAASFRTTLEAHKTAIGLALDLVGATTIRDLTSDTKPGKRTTIQRYKVDSEVMTDISRILIQMGQLRIRLPGEFEKSFSHFNLHEYMGCLKLYAETIIRHKETEHEAESRVRQPKRGIEPGAFLGEKQMFGAYVGDAPDTAIDAEIEPASSVPVGRVEDRIDEESLPVEEAIDSNIPSRAPTPPPKDLKRLEMARRKMTSPFENEPDSLTNPYGVITEISSGGRKLAPSIISNKSKGFVRLFSPFKSAGPEIRPPTQSTSSSTSTPADIRPATPVAQASLVRRGSRRFSLSIKKLPLWNTEQLEEIAGPESKAVFGVSLQRSMQVAKGVSRTHHGNNGGSSRRDFPLCVQKCCFFLKNEGVTAPDLFAEPGDIFRVAKLKEIFSMGPTYGEDVDFASYTVYDAADLIMLYLSQLPRPLIPESLAKRWISLSRQATLSGSHATRLDQCIDFWEEALSGLRGPSRSLFKLLLNLWADVATADEENDMTAERLSDVVLKPLMHVSSAQYKTDYMLSLAFLIRKRAEYTELLEDNRLAVKRISRAAW
ncbi:Rho GTPase activation protein [Nemania sp. FL0031]|nr:Rho GTPase activation protein [Nemania sp. FL0031]